MGFGAKWVRVIWWCVSAARFSILVHEVLAGFFPRFRCLRQGVSLVFLSSFKRLRQGDPLPLCLFVMGMEVLKILLQSVMADGFISGCRIEGMMRSISVSLILLFVDDTIVLCEASEDHMLYLSWLLLWFENHSG